MQVVPGLGNPGGRRWQSVVATSSVSTYGRKNFHGPTEIVPGNDAVRIDEAQVVPLGQPGSAIPEGRNRDTLYLLNLRNTRVIRQKHFIGTVCRSVVDQYQFRVAVILHSGDNRAQAGRQTLDRIKYRDDDGYLFLINSHVSAKAHARRKSIIYQLGDRLA